MLENGFCSESKACQAKVFAFDSGLITFDDRGNIVLAEDFGPGEVLLAGIDPNATISAFTSDFCSYLAEHRELMRARVARSAAKKGSARLA